MTASLSPTRARLFIIAAAMLWSLSGAFKSVLTHQTALGLDTPPVDASQIAFYRVLFAGLVLAPTIRHIDVSFRPAMIGMVLTFAAMNALFVCALTLGTAANAIFLQYTAPLWVYLAGIWWLGEKPDRRSTVAIAAGMLGIAVILSGGWSGERLDVIGCALGAGVAYAGVLLWLRILRGSSPRWLTVLNHLGSASGFVSRRRSFRPADARPTSVAIPVRRNPDGIAVLVDDPRIANDQPVGSEHAVAVGADPESVMGVSGFPGGGVARSGDMDRRGAILSGIAYRYWPARR